MLLWKNFGQFILIIHAAALLDFTLATHINIARTTTTTTTRGVPTTIARHLWLGKAVVRG